MNVTDLIQEQIETTRQIINQVEKLKQYDLAYLTWRSQPNSWNILECLEHLNRYSDYYNPEIKKAIERANKKSKGTFKSGTLGNYFAKSMLPKAKLNKMKTFKDKNPLNTNVDKSVIDKFVQHQMVFLELLKKAIDVDMNKVKITTSISKLIRIRLGDTFRFIVNHNLRHLQQIEKVQEQKTA